MNRFFPKSPDPYIKHSPDMELAKFGHLNALVDVLNSQALSQVGLVAHAGGGQALGTLLQQGFNAFSVVASSEDSATLPSLVALCACTPFGPIAPVVIVNNGASLMAVYPFPGESINGGSVNSPVTIAAGESLSFKNTSCSNWDTYGASGTSAPTGVCTDGTTITGTGLTGSCLSVVPGAVTLKYAEYVQLTQGSNASIAPGRAVLYTTDNPSGVVNTIGITTNTGPGAQGTEFVLPIGVYMVDWENSNDAAWSLAIYKSTTTQTEAIDTNTIVGSSTATTWIHGRAIVVAAAVTYLMISPVTGTHAIPTAGTASGDFVARITFLKIG